MLSRLALVALATAAAAPVFADVSLVGTHYCSVTPNSSGRPAILQVLSLVNHRGGNGLFLDDRVMITAYMVPSDAMGVVIGSPGRAQTPFGGGFLCVTPVHRIAAATSQGNWFQVEFDLADPALAHVPFAPGDWFFQLHYRDVLASAGFNLSDGVHVVLYTP